MKLGNYLEAYHTGASQAITSRGLCDIFDLQDRRLRQIIRELIRDGLPIASSTESPAGYFIVRNRAEANKYALSIKSRLTEDAIRRRDFRRAADQYLTPAIQLALVA